jgi:hypothetical protein
LQAILEKPGDEGLLPVGNLLRPGNPLTDLSIVDLGLYDYPIQDPVLGYIAPYIDAIARTLGVCSAICLQPSGSYAANILAPSEQVPDEQTNQFL